MPRMEQSLRVPVVATVEGILIHGTSAVFAGCRKSVGLGRSESFVRGSFPCRRPHRRQQVPSGRRGGERRQHAQSACTLRGDAQKALSMLEDTSFARSRDPCSSPPRKRRGRFDIAVGQPCVSRTNRHRGRNERTECGSPRVTASPREKVVRDASETEGGHGLRPCEEPRAPVGVRTSWQLQKSAGRVLAPNKLARSAPKRVAVRVNGGLGEEASGTRVSVTFSANGPLVCRPSSLPVSGDR